jgi:TolB protein
MRLVAIVSRVGASVEKAELFSPSPLARKEPTMAKTNHFGALAAAAGTLVAVGLVVLIMVIVEAGPAEATFPGKNGRIVFVRDLVLSSQIFTINPDGSGLEKISTTLLGSDPAWSPDGKKIAFSRSAYSGLLERSNLDIYVVNANGSSLKRITESPTYDFNPSFSPDGKKIAFDRYGEKGPNSVCRQSCIYTIRVDGTGLKRLTGSKVFAEDPDWSPDGKKIAYRGSDGHNDDIYTINASGGTPFNVTNNDTWELGGPSYSPDGKRIAYSSRDGHHDEIFTINVSGGGTPFNVTNNGTSDFGPSYSPDGKKIAYVSYDGHHDSEISTINATGGKPVQVTYTHTHDSDPDWGSRP